MGRHEVRYSICGDRTCVLMCRVRVVPGGVVYELITYENISKRSRKRISLYTHSLERP